MTKLYPLNAPTFALLIALTVAPAWAQNNPTITAQGAATIERPAEILRMQIDLTAKHKDVKQAIAALKQRKTEALEKLDGLAATKGSIKFGAPAIGANASNPQAQMQAMVMMRMQGRNVDTDVLESLPTTVSVQLTAEWAIKADSPEDLLLLTHELETKIKEADLGAAKQAQELTEEEEELQAEMQQFGYGGNQGPKPGEPTFIYVAKISEAERTKATADAFQDAFSKATRLADAAEVEIAVVYSLAGSAAPMGTDYAQYAYMYGMQQSAVAKGAEGEAVGMQPGKVTYRVGVSASFLIRR